MVKILFYFFLYIVGAHVFGAFWYFFGIQREMVCWHQASTKSSFYCDDISSRNVTLLNELCPINSPDPTVFDFGIFLESLQSNNRGSTNLSEKLLFSLWWGMRNLSSFGQNLATSNFVWENFFVIYMSITLLFLFYVIGKNVETYLEDKKPSSEVKPNLDLWMSQNNLPPDLKEEIIANASKLEEDVNVDVEILLSVLPWRTRKSLRRFLCISTLSNVSRLVGMDTRVLKMMCDYLKPVVFTADSYLIRSGEPLDFILLVTQGKVFVTSDGSSSTSSYIEKGDIYGDEQLLSWAAPRNDTALPMSEENVKCDTKVEGFLLTATDLEFIVSKCKKLWKYNNNGHEMVLRSKIE